MLPATKIARVQLKMATSLEAFPKTFSAT